MWQNAIYMIFHHPFNSTTKFWIWNERIQSSQSSGGEHHQSLSTRSRLDNSWNLHTHISDLVSATPKEKKLRHIVISFLRARLHTWQVSGKIPDVNISCTYIIIWKFLHVHNRLMSHEETKPCETWTVLQNILFQSGQRGKTYGTMQFDRAENLNFQQIGSRKEDDYRFEENRKQ